jgi:hypothetical protein
MKSRLVFVSAAMLVALLASFLPLAGAGVQTVAASTYCDAAQFVADVTVPDGTVFAPGATFKKTWRLKNIGTCTWTTSYNLVYVSGEKMGNITAVALPSNVAPGQTVDLSVDMTAPASAGKFRGNWQLKNASGVLFGIGSTAKGVFWVEIVVSSGGATGVAYNFADKACDAVWTSAAGTLPCPGTDGDVKGFVLKQANPKLENGVADSNPGLLVSPQAVYDGFIQGVYPAFKVQTGDRFQATVSCEGGATSCYVAYRLDYQIGGNPVKTFWSFREKYEGQFYRANLDLSSLAGQDVKFILYLSAYGSPTGDRALWGNPVLYRNSNITPGATTPVVTTTTPVAGCDKAQFVADVTVPDGTTFAPGAAFKKTWRLKNIGTCTWTTGYQLVFVNGEQMGGPASAVFPTAVAPGQTVDLSVNLVAPSAGGTYRGNWMLKNSTGVTFGIGSAANKPFWVEIKVTGPTPTGNTPTPTVTATGPTPTQAANTAYDFAANACAAKWVSGAGVLPCPGTDGDAKGFVLTINNPQLETGATDPRPGLLTHPQITTNGYIQGTYPAFRVQSGDHFQSIVNCQYNATSCYVVFRLDYQIGDATPKTYWTFGEKYEGQYFTADIDLTSLAGQDVKFILTVMAGTYASGDRALWVGPRIYRPSAAPVSASATLSPTATATATATGTGSNTSGWNTYLNTSYSFSFKFPPGSVVGTTTNSSAHISLPFNVGTLLADKYVDVSVVEGANPCKSANGTPVTSGNVTFNGITFLKETGSDAAAGNIYEWESYSVVRPNTTACVTVDFVLHSTNAGNYTTPPPPFDKAAESAVFQTIMSTFAWVQ